MDTNGVISGTPTAAGTFNATLKATNAAGTNSQAATFTISKGSATITTNPVATAITFGLSLVSSSLSGGTGSVPGSFAFTTPSATPSAAGSYSAEITFTPDDTNYNSATATITVTVNKATPTVSTPPTAGSVTNGLALSNSVINGGSVNPGGGTWAWSMPATAVLLGTNSYAATYSPASGDQGNWNPVTNSLTVVGLATSVGESIGDFLQGQPTNAETVGKWLIGGATNFTDASERPVLITTNSDNLVLLAIVRTNDVNYTTNQVVGQYVTNLLQFSTLASGSNEVLGIRSDNQTNVLTGFERREFSVPRSNGTNRLFLRLKATLNP